MRGDVPALRAVSRGHDGELAFRGAPRPRQFRRRDARLRARVRAGGDGGAAGARRSYRLQFAASGCALRREGARARRVGGAPGESRSLRRDDARVRPVPAFVASRHPTRRPRRATFNFQLSTFNSLGFAFPLPVRAGRGGAAESPGGVRGKVWRPAAADGMGELRRRPPHHARGLRCGRARRAPERFPPPPSAPDGLSGAGRGGGAQRGHARGARPRNPAARRGRDRERDSRYERGVPHAGRAGNALHTAGES